MTEVPEHLLKRSKERRAALGLGGDEGTESAATPAPTASSASPAPAAAAAPAAPAGPPPRKGTPAVPAAPAPKPDAPYVARAKSRAKVPFWAMGALALLPVWGFMYVRALTTEDKGPEGPLAVGTSAYSSCGACHGGNGEGGSGYAFTEGESLKTFPHIEDQLRWVMYGTDAYNLAGITIYGDPNREGGPHMTGGMGVMPGWTGQLTDAEILGVVCHERYDLGGVDPAGDMAGEFDLWCSPESPIFEELSAGGTLAALGESEITGPDGSPATIIPIGEAPAAATPSGAG